MSALSICGSLLLLGYVLYFFLIQSHALWESPTLVPDRWKQVFGPIAGLFPTWWIRPYRWDDTGYVAAALYVMLLAALFAVFVFGLRRAFRVGAFSDADRPRAIRRVMLWTALALGILLVVPGALSTDLFSYAWYGRIFGVFGQNPFIHTPADFTFHDPGKWLQWVYWKETPSVYGPVWVTLAGLIARIAQALGGDIVYHVLGHKLLASLAHLANVLLLWKVAGLVIERYWHRPTRHDSRWDEASWRASAQVGVTLVYAWNPLVMLEFGANSHNDVLMLTGVLAAVWLYLTGRWRTAMVAFGLATLVKFIAVLFVPGFLWLLFWESAPGGALQGFRRLAWRVIQAGTVFVGTLMLCYLPFWAGPATLKPLVTGPPVEMFVNSLGSLVRFQFAEGIHNLAAALGWKPAEFWTEGAIGDRLDWPARWGANLLFAGLAVVLTWGARNFPRMVVAWGWILFFYLTIGAVWFWPWYVSWLLVVAALVGPGRLWNASVLLSGTSMLLYATYWRSDRTVAELETWRPLIMMLPPLVYVAGSILLARWRAGITPAPVPTPLRLPGWARTLGHRETLPPAVRVRVAPALGSSPENAAGRRAPVADSLGFGGSPSDGILAGEPFDH